MAKTRTASFNRPVQPKFKRKRLPPLSLLSPVPKPYAGCQCLSRFQHEPTEVIEKTKTSLIPSWASGRGSFREFTGFMPLISGVAILLTLSLAHVSIGAEQDPRMVPPPNAVTGKLPSIAATPAREAAKAFRVLDGFRMDLLAAEPLVASPVAMTYDENGRAYVCEMRDYPYTDKAHHQRNQENPTDAAIGAVCLLEDTDGDGVFDKSTIFADGLSWPTGGACRKGG